MLSGREQMRLECTYESVLWQVWWL